MRRTGGKLRQFPIELNPFQITVFDFSVVPDGWYTINCTVGKSYSSLVRSSQDIVIARHL